MCMITDKVAETIRGNIETETKSGKHRTTPQIVFNLNFFMPGMGPFPQNGVGSAGSLLTQGGQPIQTQSGQSIGV